VVKATWWRVFTQRGTLSGWIKAAGVPIRGQSRSAVTVPPVGETPEQEVARLRTRVVELEDAARKVNTERDILRAAAKYVAWETNW